MSATMQPPPGAPPAPPPSMVPNPVFAQWQQLQQAAQAIQQANAQKQQQFDAACALIKSDGVRGFKLDIEADSTIAADEQAEKAARTEFLQQMIPMLEQVVPLAQGNPPLATLAKEMSLFAVRGFRVARTLEEAFENAFDAIAKMPPNPKVSGQGGKPGAPPPNPQLEQAKVAADVHDTQMKAQTDQLAIAQKAQEAADQMQIERERAASEAQHNQADLMIRTAELHQRGALEQARTLRTDAASTRGME